MKSTVNVHSFREAFRSCGRGEQFSYQALGEIFAYIDEYEQSCGSEIELDPIAICCEFSEDTIGEAVLNYALDLDPIECTAEDVCEALMDAGSAWAVPVDEGTVVYLQF